MLRPKQTKFNKYRKIRIKRIEQRQITLKFGSFGLKALEGGQISSRQIEAVRRVITRKLKKTGQLWIRIFPNIPVSKKPIEVRMGKGKGAVEYWAARVKPGRIMFEMDGVPLDLAREAFERAAAKLPIATRFVTRLGEN